jgi:hypothetical protein
VIVGPLQGVNACLVALVVGSLVLAGAIRVFLKPCPRLRKTTRGIGMIALVLIAEPAETLGVVCPLGGATPAAARMVLAPRIGPRWPFGGTLLAPTLTDRLGVSLIADASTAGGAEPAACVWPVNAATHGAARKLLAPGW